MSDQEMLKQVMEDIRLMRVCQSKKFDEIAKDIAKIREEMARQKGKVDGRLATITAGISLAVAGFMTWVMRHLTN